MLGFPLVRSIISQVKNSPREGIAGSMRAQTIGVKEATGRVLCCTVFRAGGKKLLAKGHVISDEDARMLETEGMSEVWVTELQDGEVGEDEAVIQVASEIGCGLI